MKNFGSILQHKSMCQEFGINSYTVKILIVWKDKIIVLQRGKKNIELVGGMNKLEDNEDVHGTAIRKVMEETSIDISTKTLHLLDKRYRERDEHSLYFFLVVINDDDTRNVPYKPDKEGKIPRAYRLRGILETPFMIPRTHREIIEQYIQTA